VLEVFGNSESCLLKGPLNTFGTHPDSTNSTPHSTIHRKNSVPHYPAIHPNYLATRTDCDTIVAGLRMTRDICRQEPVKSLITEEYSPGKDVESDDYDAMLNWARDTATTIYHPTGTCKMGDDAMAVVDARLRVHGIAGLRVADASIMPTITSGNTNAPTIMIGEKLAQMVLADNQ